LFVRTCKEAARGLDYSIEEIRTAWKKAIPFIDRVIGYEESINKLSDDKRDFLKRNLIYDKTIDGFIKEYEESNILQTVNVEHDEPDDPGDR
jgi:hypothetical protein